ncbi:hypothetical protein [Brachybacterium sp. GCM10030252]|uniref:hypothetical protein n=1 Tax=Brachybacterium sp. GCM10030252 TaxID=3273380 RepID=UPI0036180D7A
MGSDTRTGDIPEDTVDLRERHDPVRTLLRAAARGEQGAAASLVDVLAPRIHGLAVHVTGSSARAEKLTVSVLRSCLADAGELAASGLPGEVAVLDRARRACVATRPSGDVRSLVASDPADERTRDRRENEVLRVLLRLPASHRALVESAAQGRFHHTGSRRSEAAEVLAGVLDQLVPLGGPVHAEAPTLSALDALALADESERRRLQELSSSPATSAVRRHAIEAAAQLTLLTAIVPSRDLRPPVLEGFGPGPQPGPETETEPQPETAYRGDYATPVLGTDSQRRVVGPPAMPGSLHTISAASSASPQTHTTDAAPPGDDARPTPAPAFSFRDSGSPAARGASGKRPRPEHGDRPAPRGVPWFSRAIAALALIGALLLAWFLLDARRELAAAHEFTSTWTELSVEPEAMLVPGLSDNGSWQAVITADAIALRAEGVSGYEGEVLQLWGEQDGVPTDLGVLELGRDGLVRATLAETAESLVVTREMAPRNRSGTPSERVVANLDPELTADPAPLGD